jgi:glycerol-3-phosphate dehydrogenase
MRWKMRRSCFSLPRRSPPAKSPAWRAPQSLPLNALVVACAKGIDRRKAADPKRGDCRPSANHVVGVLSGPSFAADVVRGLPTAVTLALPDRMPAQSLAQALSGDAIRIYASDDVVGVQIGGSLKNVMAIAVGICRGGGMGASAEAALITRGYAELVRLGVGHGGARRDPDGPVGPWRSGADMLIGTVTQLLPMALRSAAART